MVEKKALLSDLKKYNKDLEKYLPSLDSTFLNKDFLNKKSVIDDDYYALLASNLVDIRTELALLRKNMVNDVEAMVLNSISNQENMFLNQINKFYGQIIGDLKGNFAKYINEMNEEITSLKKKIVEVSSQNKNFDNKLSMFNENLFEFKTLVNKFDLDANKISFKTIENKFDSFFKTIENKKNTIMENKNMLEIESKLNLIEKNFTNVNEILTKKNEIFEKSILNLNKKIINIKKDNLKNSNIIDDPNKEKINKIENKLSNFNSKIEDLKKIKSIKEKIIIVDDRIKIKNQIHKFENSKIEKLLEIDTKLNKLNSLR